MRKSDKKKNMGKANLIAENRYFESKGLIKEDVEEGVKPEKRPLVKQEPNTPTPRPKQPLVKQEKNPPIPKPKQPLVAEGEENLDLGLWERFFQGTQNINDAEFLTNYMGALESEIQSARSFLNKINNGESNMGV